MNQNNQKKYYTSFITLLFFSISLRILHCFFFIYYLLYSFSEYLFQNLLLSLYFFALGILHCFIFIYYLVYSFSEYPFQNLVLSLYFIFLHFSEYMPLFLLHLLSFGILFLSIFFQKVFLQVSLSLWKSLSHIICLLLPSSFTFIQTLLTKCLCFIYLGKFYRLCNVLQLPKHPSWSYENKYTLRLSSLTPWGNTLLNTVCGLPWNTYVSTHFLRPQSPQSSHLLF